jgi:cytochrome c553
MRRVFGVSLLVMIVGFGIAVWATEKPPKDFQDLMKSNGSIIDITLGTVGNNTGGGGGSEPASLRAHMRAKDYEGIAKDAATLRANFTKIEAFWVARKVDDAINFSKAALKASADLETAAKAKDDAGVSASASAVAATCRSCHQAHRIMQLVDRTFEIM